MAAERRPRQGSPRSLGGRPDQPSRAQVAGCLDDGIEQGLDRAGIEGGVGQRQADHLTAVDGRMAHEGLATASELVAQQRGRHPLGGEADVDELRLPHQLELGLATHALGGQEGQLAEPGDALPQPSGAQVLPGGPELEGVVATAALQGPRTGIELVPVALEQVAGGLVEAGRHEATLTHQEDRAGQGHPHQLVGVPGHGVDLLAAGQEVGLAGIEDRGAAEGAIRMEPEVVGAGHLRQGVQGVEGAEHRGADGGVDLDGQVACIEVRADGSIEGRWLHTPASVDGDLDHVVAADPEGGRGLGHRVVGIHGGVDTHATSVRALVAQPRTGAIPGQHHAGQVGDGATRGEDPVGIREPDGSPHALHQLELDQDLWTADLEGVHGPVQGGGGHLPQQRGRLAATEELVEEAPLPKPYAEIWVYSPAVEGVHLRGGPVARGGLRWSDRREDFRTEVLGLVKAQQVKNAVIVPVGSKGGFVLKKAPPPSDRAAFMEEGIACYRLFMSGMLDITDNLVGDDVVPPVEVVRKDADDPYLVVAADKGTATFSDFANEMAIKYGFWLGDAFASGGSVGYDHKKMGITARGAWESVKRHFREIGIDCQTTDFTCVGVGDMGGDVFGNGMLLSEHTRLIVAFNHLHIFFDPDPDAAKSYKERQRLFEKPSLTWDDYDKSLISKGGGVFSRAAKSITLTPEMKTWLGTRQNSMTPTELIHNYLKMPVDLIWNGGIGTYVKSKKESHSDVGDRANDALRVNGCDLKAKIIGEGGNLGATQLGRMEFAANGGRVNTDFIDNVGGVDCSDNEVNIKILLNALVSNGDLTVKQRNNLLYDMTDDVAKIVLQDCYRQTQTISVTEMTGVSSLKEQLRFIHGLERDGALNRELEFIPNDDEISDRAVQNRGLTRPELSVITAYGKMVLKDQLNIPALTDNPYHGKLLISAFPPVLRERFAEQMQQHPLRAEIIATKLTNNMVNDMGANFVYRMQEETGADIVEITNAYSIVKGVFSIGQLWQDIESLDNKVDAKVQLAMLESARRLMRRGTRWYIRHGDNCNDIQQCIEKYQPAVNDLCENLSNYLVKQEISQLEKATQNWMEKGVPQDIAARVAAFSNLFSALDLTQVVEQGSHSIDVVGRLYYQLGSTLELHWFLEQINNQPVGNHWQALARASYREELDWQQRSIVATLLAGNTKSKDADAILDNWMQNNEALLKRWYHMMSEFKTSSSHDFAKFSVALRELMLLSMKSNQ